MRRAIGRNHPVVIQFQDRPVQDEGQRRDQLRPHARQQHAGHDDHQRIEKIKGTVPPAGLVDHQADQYQISQDLQRSLQPVLLPERSSST